MRYAARYACDEDDSLLEVLYVGAENAGSETIGPVNEAPHRQVQGKKMQEWKFQDLVNKVNKIKYIRNKRFGPGTKCPTRTLAALLRFPIIIIAYRNNRK